LADANADDRGRKLYNEPAEAVVRGSGIFSISIFVLRLVPMLGLAIIRSTALDIDVRSA
jgi:hypothetical protein